MNFLVALWSFGRVIASSSGNSTQIGLQYNYLFFGYIANWSCYIIISLHQLFQSIFSDVRCNVFRSYLLPNIDLDCLSLCISRWIESISRLDLHIFKSMANQQSIWSFDMIYFLQRWFIFENIFNFYLLTLHGLDMQLNFLM